MSPAIFSCRMSDERDADEAPAVIRKILNHLQEQSPLDSGVPIPNSRAPPQALLFN
jgi:hypothetical protein